jgi:wobble nucleotide-excising tRNase
MKIKKITQIKNFGSFKNFEWSDELQQFNKYNFFYGWNYSGKTTLSRIFRCLENKALNEDFREARFKIETDSGIITEKDLSNDYQIRVFNEDFVVENFKWHTEEQNIPPILILGKEAKDLEEERNRLGQEKNNKGNEKIVKEKDKKEKESQIEKLLTIKASEIRNILGITKDKEFDKLKLKSKIEEIKSNYLTFLLSEVEKSKKLEFYRSKKKEKVEFTKPELKLTGLISKVSEILSLKITPEQIIEKLKNNPKLNNWVREGIELHKAEKECQFCGNPLPEDLFERLEKHFSQEYDNFIKNIKNLEDEITRHINEIKELLVHIPDESRLFEDLQSQYKEIVSAFKNEIEFYIQSLNELKNEINRKKEKPFESLELKSIRDNTKEVKKYLEQLRFVLESHNSKVDSFESEKQEVKEELIKHFTAEFIKDEKYIEKQEEIEDLKKEIEKLDEKIEDLSKKIDEIDKKIKAEVIGAEKINYYLKQFFNDDKLHVRLTNDGKYYRLYRGGEIAKNLSTGEKNIISLVYFFAKLEERGFDFNNGIIFIDDPVSSLDSNHIHRIYGFISSKFKKCGQLFITTHNFDFFNLLKDAYKYDLRNKDGAFYLIKTINNDKGKYSTIEKLPNLLLQFKSEYNYLFSILKEFNESDDNDKPNFEFLYLIPNILRRFFEGYLFMRYPDGRIFKDKAERFLGGISEDVKTTILKLMDEYSHEENPTYSTKYPDIQETSIAVEKILSLISNKDEEHYKALCETVKPPKTKQVQDSRNNINLKD